jgi:hypothetical protein
MYPILQEDIYLLADGDICMSEQYFNQVLEAKIRRFGE